MPMTTYKPEQIVTLLRQVEVDIVNGKTPGKPARKRRSLAVAKIDRTSARKNGKTKMRN